MKKEDYIKSKDIITNDNEYPTSVYDEAKIQVDKWEFANQRVIEELEKQVENYFNQETETYLSDRLINRIEQLKQD